MQFFLENDISKSMRERAMITIRRAVYEDIPDIMKFMDEYWKPGNILAKNREFFEWQFLEDNKVNMFLGVDESGKIYGMIGAIVYNRSTNPDISGCTWQVIKSDNPMLGLDLANYRDQCLGVRYCCGAGLTNKAVKIQKLLGYTITEMDHYYRLADKKKYKIAKVEKKIIPKITETGYRLEHIGSVNEMKQLISERMLLSQIPSKDYSYIEKRYFEHPIYRYDIWKIIDKKEKSQSVLITRDETMEDSKVCEIIDHYGEMTDLGKITGALDCLMEERGYEFVDIYSYGIPIEIYEQAGFCCCNQTSKNIIPNYFHPFVRENISLKMVKTMMPNLRLFRGDGDQDRPC